MSKKLDVRYENKFCYNIFIEKNWENLTDYLMKIYSDNSRKFCIVSDSNVAPIYLSTVYKKISEKYNDVITFEFPAGESQKTLENISRLYDVLISKKFQRKDVLVALGGGVVGDMTGFTAATFLRGIDFIQIPTTLLSQVDSSIGGKTGVDFRQYKNMIGAFHMPKMVYINVDVLHTLPKEQFSSGMGEVIKHGLIKDKEYFYRLDQQASLIQSQDIDALSDMIYDSCAIKRDVVEEDPKEQGIRAMLNFGHTIGHAIETCKEYQLSHGACVALGMIAAAKLSLSRGWLASNDVDRIVQVIKKFDLPIFTSDIRVKDVLEISKSDKKMVGNEIKFIVLDDIGKARIDRSIKESELIQSIEAVIS